MGHILGIKFADYGQPYYFDAGPFVVERGRFVLVKTDQGLGMGEVVDVREETPPHVNPADVKPIYRLANDEDLAQRAENLELAREAREHSRRCIQDRELDMKLVDVEVFFDRSKLVFYFTAPGRIDFRDLVKDLVRQYRTRIELRQIGVRHETQMIGALGNCGQTCCCRRFLRKFHPVTIKMAKEQNLFLNPTKISGICGRLLCCLSFEQHNYEEFHSRCPRIGKKFTTTLGRAKVLRLNFFRQTVHFLLESGEEKEASLAEWERLTGRAAEGEPLAEAGFEPASAAFSPEELALSGLEDPDAGLRRFCGQGGRSEGRPGGRPEGRGESRSEGRPESRAESRSESRPESRAEGRSEGRPDARRDRPRRERRPGSRPEGSRPEGGSPEGVRSEGQRPEGRSADQPGRRPGPPRRPDSRPRPAGGGESRPAAAQPGQGERPDRPDQAERPDRPDQAERPARPGQPPRRPRRKRNRRPGPEQGE
jgi:cell fate regulator YaaT (PSP1 superfamily)